MSRVLRSLFAAVVLLRATVVPALADDQLLAGKKLFLKSSSTEGSAKLVAKDATIAVLAGGTGGDPTCSGAGGGGTSSIRFIGSGGAVDVSISLPCAGWTANSSNTVYKYKDSTGATCAKLLIKNGKLLKAACSGPQVAIEVTGTLAPVDVVTTLNGQAYCASFGGAAIHDGSDGTKFLHKDAAAPASCGGSVSTTLPPTTTTMEPTTTTLAPTTTLEPTTTTLAPTTTMEPTTTTLPPTTTSTTTTTLPPCNDPDEPINLKLTKTVYPGGELDPSGTVELSLTAFCDNGDMPPQTARFFSLDGTTATTMTLDNSVENHLTLDLIDPSCASEYEYQWNVFVPFQLYYLADVGMTGFLARELTIGPNAIPDDNNPVDFYVKATRIADGRSDIFALHVNALLSELTVAVASHCQSANSPEMCMDCSVAPACPSAEAHYTGGDWYPAQCTP